MTRAERRHRWERTKRRYMALWRQWHKPAAIDGKVYRGYDGRLGRYIAYTARELAASVAHLAETHGRPCSCWGCKRGQDVPPPRERAFVGFKENES
jgi:hypothetical protein